MVVHVRQCVLAGAEAVAEGAAGAEAAAVLRPAGDARAAAESAAAPAGDPAGDGPFAPAAPLLRQRCPGRGGGADRRLGAGVPGRTHRGGNAGLQRDHLLCHRRLSGRGGCAPQPLGNPGGPLRGSGLLCLLSLDLPPALGIDGKSDL